MTTASPLRIGIVGCGQIADAHLQELQHVPGSVVVATCDQQIELAEQASLRFGVPGAYGAVTRMLEEAAPNVVHLTTPPHTHGPLACELIRAGVHVYVEKPFTLDVAEARRVIDCAEEHKRLVCVGHDHLFDPVWQRLEAIVASGEIGEIVHMDSVMGYNLEGPFGRLMFRDPSHWLHRLPGGLFQNNISHALYRVAAFMPDEAPRVCATMSRRHADEPPSELRVMLQGRTMTANVLFSSRARPVQRTLRVYGSRATVELDAESRVIRRHHASGLPGAFGKLHVPWLQWREAGRNLRRNAMDFLASRQQYFAGMRELFIRFQRSVREEGPPPIAYPDIIRVTAWMDAIFENASVHVEKT